MEAISELQVILSHYFSWNKSRIDCLCRLIFAIITVQTVNLSSVAVVLHGNAKIQSHYKRLQRFFGWLAGFHSDAQRLLFRLTLSALNLEKNSILYAAMDRTNWQFGMVHINLLVIGISYHGVNIPIVWTSLGKAGSSSSQERIQLLKRFQKILDGFPFVLTADREFTGKKWIGFLCKRQIPFVIRIKGNSSVRRPKCSHSIPAKDLFKQVKNKRRKVFQEPHEVFEVPVFIAAARNKEGELLIVISNQFCGRSIKEYLKRWGVECMFSCLKSRGFNFEDTHMSEPKKISSLLFVLTIVLVWSMRTGVNRRKECPITLATHGRKRMSVFRRGLEGLRRCIVNLTSEIERFISFINLLLPKGDPGYSCEGVF